ncbi:probable apyrase 7 isoform X2 [Salvia hispanica]|uniref:probable apyrase 7 isoform X2 n=1 Tax=Salvia hispanica TaxID=49212 RepID=UPI0020094738|nr:probable apyrase 7 isoform X2 [Salvia hispanica]
MVFSKISELFSPGLIRLSASNKPPGSPIPASPSGLPKPEKRSNLRLSYSLQDLSTYRRLDIEEGNKNAGVERSSGHALPPYIFEKEKGAASFSKEKLSPGTSSRKKRWITVVCILIGLFLVSCLSFGLQNLYTNWSRGTNRFYVVVDCGSTGTRVFVYQASISHEKDNNLPISLKSLPEDSSANSVARSGRAYNRMETEPGFDKLVHNISGLQKAIKPLIEWAENQIPKNSHRSTSLFLHATAGVRRLPSSDSEWLLENAWLILKRSPFLCKKEWVKTITGVEEAYYGWIALNYHTKVLGSVPKKETYGALDLGGSSLQVTFEGKQGDLDETSLKLGIGPVNHHLSAYSLAGYGLNDAFDKSVGHLLKGLPHISNANLTSGKVEINHPCLQYGYKEQYMCRHCSLLEGGNSGVPVQLVGVPNWAKCSLLAKAAVNRSEWSNSSIGIDCGLHPCALAENIPRPRGQFYAMSGFYVVYRFFNLTPEATLDDVLEKGRRYCDKSWLDAKKSVVPQPFIEQYCFRAPYVVLLLREGLHIPDSHVTVGSGSITWTLGVALFEAGKAFPFSGKSRGYDIFQVRINPLFVLAFSLAVLFFLVCFSSCVGKSSIYLRRRYLPLFNHTNMSSASVLNIPSPFQFKHWSRPVHIVDGRAKDPMSPVPGTQLRGHDDGGDKFTRSHVAHSYSSGSLGELQFGNTNVGPAWTPPNRSQTRLQSRRSQSREDLISSMAEGNAMKP